MTRRRRRLDIPQRCPVSGKVRFPDRATAKRVAGRVYPGDLLPAYRCDDDGGCGFWHIGHPPYGGRRPGTRCDVDTAPVYVSLAAVAVARIAAGPGWTVARCGTHWHLAEVPAA